MKRPLFCVALAYALGEVIGVCTRTMEEKSIVAAMLLCAGIYTIGIRRWRCAGVILGSVLLGIACAFFCIPAHLRAQPEKAAYEETDYRILTYENKGREPVYVKAVGILSDRQGETWVMRVCDLQGETRVPRYVLLRGMEDAESSCRIGDMVFVQGSLIGFDPVRNPGGFRAEVYYRARKIEDAMYGPQIELFACPSGKPVLRGMLWYYHGKRCLYALRERFDETLHRYLPEETAALFSGILLGDKSGIEPETKKLYQVGGIAHILAISGLHISLIGGLFFRLLRAIRLPYPAAGILAIVFTVCYGCFTGMSLATMRAVWMLAISLGAQMLGRHYDMPTAMGLALSVMLLGSPVRILDAGMQLSYMAVAGVSLGNYLLRSLHKQTRFRRFSKRHRRLFRIVQSLLYSATLNAMMLPVLAKSYYTIPVYAWVWNLIVIPCMTVVFVSGWGGLLVSLVVPGIGHLVFLPGNWILKLYETLCRWSVALPGNTLCTGEIHMWQIVVWYGGIGLALLLGQSFVRNRLRDFVYKRMGRFWQRKQVVSYHVWSLVTVLLLEGVAQTLFYQGQQVEEVCFLDVGQGDGILIRTAGGCGMLIDGGTSSQSSLAEYTLLPALKSQGITTVDYWFVTHTDTDHISGLSEILSMGALAQIRIRAVVFSAYVVQDAAYEQLLQQLDAAGVYVAWMKEGDVVTDGTGTLTCVHPDASYPPADKNAASLALSYHSEAFDMLFTGDMDADAVTDMLQDIGESPEKNDVSSGLVGMQQNARCDRPYDCIKLPHHGSKYSYVEALYAQGGYGVISCGQNNRYGHPHTEVLDGLKQAETRVLRTDAMGAVIFRSR